MTSLPSTELDDEKRRAIEILSGAERFLLAGHMRPDGDCVGSQGALARVLGSLGKEVVILNPDHPGDQFDYLYQDIPFRFYEGGALPEHDVCVLLDINELSRCGALAEPIAQAPSKKVVIDHHPHHGEPWWDASFVDVSASATGVLVRRIARIVGADLDGPMAKALFTSLVTDTGWFRYGNTDAETLSLAAELVDAGVDPATIFGALFQRNPLAEPVALAGLLQRLEYFADGRLAVVDQPIRGSGSGPLEDADALLDILRSVGQVEVVLFLREIEGGVCKLSARSKTTYDVNALARRFGGGGHVRASGATIRGELADVRTRLVESALEDLSASSDGGPG